MWLYIICIYQPTGQQASPYTISESFLWSDLFMLFNRPFSGLCSHLYGLTLLLNGCCEISAGAGCHLMTTWPALGLQSWSGALLFLTPHRTVPPDVGEAIRLSRVFSNATPMKWWRANQEDTSYLPELTLPVSLWLHVCLRIHHILKINLIIG